jgi:N6-L-threonylcarbamoyladenine synthase
MLGRAGFDFSFSGLKTAAALAVRAARESAGGELSDTIRADIAHEAQAAIVETLIARTLRALDETGHEALVVAGGVSANSLLRAELQRVAAARGVRVYYPRLEFCTDNAAMIALAGLVRLKRGAHESLAIRARAQWPLQELSA